MGKSSREKKCGKQKLSYPYESFKEREIFTDNEF